jgi:hypothetical protein
MATLVLILHVLWVAVVVFSVPLIALGGFFGWKWVRNRIYRRVHLAMMAIVVAETVFSIPCPLTIWEDLLRKEAGHQGYSGGFIAHWLRVLLYYDFEPWVFTAVYLLFFLIIVALYRLVPPVKG